MSTRPHGAWATQNLAEFVALVFSMQDEDVALERANERIAETLEADAVALVGEESVHAATGFPEGEAPVDALNATVAAQGGELRVPGAGSCPAVVVALDVVPPMHLVVARGGDDPLRADELGLLRGMARVLGAALDSLRIIERERVLRERSERQARENDRLVHGQFHDALTGLPNRALFIDRLDHALARAGRSHEELAILVCDLDGFKAVNDSLGHAAGDDLLSQVARRLVASIRPGDTVARLGGDEFAVLLEELADPGDAAHTAQRLLAAIGEPFRLGDRELFLSASIGIAAGTGEADELLRNADLALYRSQSAGPGNYSAFEPAMHAEIVERMELEVDLKGAAQRGELVLHYQPILSLHSGDSVGVEALARWQHPRRGLLAPEQFIHVAEQSGEILELGRWVLREACQQAARWGEATSKASELYVSVNLSGAQLADPALVTDVTAALDASGLAPSHLMLEMTETVLMLDSDVNIQRLAALRELGVRLAIDDFGTGYSSLNYLSRFPIDTLKIAKAFVDPLGERYEEPAILRAMLDLAHIFGLSTIAEGVENARQWERLNELGCDLAQGFFRWPPADAQELQALFEPAQDATETTEAKSPSAG
jgi:diguanylate cyclase (GGDEF)-like protein